MKFDQRLQRVLHLIFNVTIPRRVEMKLQIEHLEVISVFMENHTDFPKGRLLVSNARNKFKELWSILSNRLNSLGLGTKSVDKWQKTWSDYKGNLKKRAAEIKKLQNATPIKYLTVIEKKILEILGPTFFRGVGIEEKGIDVRASVSDTANAITSVPDSPKALTTSHITDPKFQDDENMGEDYFLSTHSKTPSSKKGNWIMKRTMITYFFPIKM